MTSLVEAIFWALLHSVWLGVGVAGAVLALLPLMRGPHQRYVLLVLGQLAFAGGTLVAFVVEYLPLLNAAAGRSLLGSADSLSVANNPAPAWMYWVVAIWTAGFVLASARVGRGWLHLQSLRRHCVPLVDWQPLVDEMSETLRLVFPVKIAESRDVSTPRLAGCRG